MKRIAILTCIEMPEMLPYDHVVIDMLKRNNISTEVFIWDEILNVEILLEFDLVLLRTIWDYYKKTNLFIEFLNKLEMLNVNMLNPLDIVRWNMDKRYLLQLQQEGFDIIPTLFSFNNEELFDEAIKRGWERMILKPIISAGSYHTFVLNGNEKNKYLSYKRELFNDRPYMLQEFIPEISEGEISTITLTKPGEDILNGFSYSVTKVPKRGDYRVQFNYGGVYHLVDVDPVIKDISHRITSRFNNKLLYQRLDGLWRNNKFLIMELELIEPDLYFNYSEKALNRFVENVLSIL